jgi:hypothetical protein
MWFPFCDNPSNHSSSQSRFLGLRGNERVSISLHMQLSLDRHFLFMFFSIRIDTVEDFKWMEKGKLRLIGKRRRALAANRRGYNPRAYQMSDEASEDMTPITHRAKKGDRVTVHYERDQPPTLLLRFSHLSVSTPSDLELNLTALDPDPPNPKSPAPYGSLVTANRGRRGITSIQPFGSNDIRTESRFLTVPPLAKTQESPRSPSLDFVRLTTPMSHHSQTSDPPAIAYPLPSAVTTGKRATASMSGHVPSTPSASQQAHERQLGYGNSFFSLSRSNSTRASSGPPRSQPVLRLVIPPYSWSVEDTQRSSSAASSRSKSDVGSPDVRSERTDPPGQGPVNPIKELPPDQSAADTTSAKHQSRTRHPSLVLHDERRDTVRIKSIGRVPRKTTPLPTPVQTTRASIRIERVSSSQMRVANEEGVTEPKSATFMRYGSLSFLSPP